jgi:hypothetical protein
MTTLIIPHSITLMHVQAHEHTNNVAFLHNQNSAHDKVPSLAIIFSQLTPGHIIGDLP